jgi:hypothetical protein
MKRLLYFAVLTFVFGTTSIQLFAQACPVCAIDLTCDSVPAAAKLCPSNLPPDTAGQYYDADLTFYMPKQFQHPAAGTVTINQIDVTGVTNLPPGMSWTAYNYLGVATNTFYPNANPPQSERGCAKICGTPPLPFDDSIYVNAVAQVSHSFGSSNENITFGIYLKLIPNPSGAASFTINNPMGCGSVTTTFTSLFPSNGNSNYSYSWNFGNGLQSSAENPPAQTYGTPGTYYVTLKTTIDTFKFSLKNITVNAVGCSDFGSAVDLYLKIFDGSNALVLQTPAIVDQPVPQSWNLSIEMNNPPYTVQVWDEDGGFAGADDNCVNGQEGSSASIPLNLPASNQYGNTVQSDNNGSLNISYTINKPVLIFNDTAQVTVFGYPPVLPLGLSPNDTVCSNDSVLVSVTGGYTYQWYRDTVLIVGANDSVYYAKQSGTYWVKVTNASGCSSNSNSQVVTIIALPAKPQFFQSATNTLKSFSVADSLQWFLNGMPISGANQTTLMIDTSGYYKLCGYNILDCEVCSDSLYFTYVGVGIENGEAVLAAFNLFPNPNKGRFNLNFELPVTRDVQIVIADMLGRVIYTEEKLSFSGQYSQIINLENTEAGIYFLSVRAGELRYNHRVIVERQ